MSVTDMQVWLRKKIRKGKGFGMAQPRTYPRFEVRHFVGSMFTIVQPNMFKDQPQELMLSRDDTLMILEAIEQMTKEIQDNE